MFGMGTGGSSLPSPPESCEGLCLRTLKTPYCTSPFGRFLSRFAFRSAFRFFFVFPLDQALDLLVPASSTHRCASTASLSTLSSSRGLTSLRCGNLLLEGGFTLRCLQRLSLPYFASLLCRWHDNSCTSGTSIPVLSY